MHNSTAMKTPDPRLARALAHLQSGETIQAEMLYAAVLRDEPRNVAAAAGIARLAAERQDGQRALHHFELALMGAPDEPSLLRGQAEALLQLGRPLDALASARRLTTASPDDHLAWLLRAQTHAALDDALAAARAWFQAVTRAQKQGRWLNPQTVEPPLLEFGKVAVGQRRRLTTTPSATRHFVSYFIATRVWGWRCTSRAMSAPPCPR